MKDEGSRDDGKEKGDCPPFPLSACAIARHLTDGVLWFLGWFIVV